MAGSAHGSAKTPAELEEMTDGRPVRQRTTTYGEVSAERQLASRQVTSYLPLLSAQPAGAAR
jgi:FO synthase